MNTFNIAKSIPRPFRGRQQRMNARESLRTNEQVKLELRTGLHLLSKGELNLSSCTGSAVLCLFLRKTGKLRCRTLTRCESSSKVQILAAGVDHSINKYDYG